MGVDVYLLKCFYYMFKPEGRILKHSLDCRRRELYIPKESADGKNDYKGKYNSIASKEYTFTLFQLISVILDSLITLCYIKLMALLSHTLQVLFSSRPAFHVECGRRGHCKQWVRAVLLGYGMTRN